MPTSTTLVRWLLVLGVIGVVWKTNLEVIPEQDWNKLKGFIIY